MEWIVNPGPLETCMQHLRSFIWSLYTGKLQLVEAIVRMIKTCYNAFLYKHSVLILPVVLHITLFAHVLLIFVLRYSTNPFFCWVFPSWRLIFLCFHQHVFPLCATILLILAWRWWQNPPHVTRWRWGSLYSITLVLQKAQTTIRWTSISRKWPCGALSVGSDRGFIIRLCKDW